MTHPTQSGDANASAPAGANGVYPQIFSLDRLSSGADCYLGDSCTRKLVEFFHTKGLHALKEEDRREQWYDDWIGYQREHHLYASLLTPNLPARPDSQLDLLRLTRFLEVFGYLSPAHGYSLQCTFLGLFPILMSENASLREAALAELDAGGLFAFGVSEKAHGADVLGNEFTVRASDSGRLMANGSKYYIGNCNCAAMITILARKEDAQRARGTGRRSPMLLFALRTAGSNALRNVRKIPTFGVRAAFVGEFEVVDHEVAEQDVIAEGRDAWDALFGTVTLGKFFLGFGSIGICEHALEEAVAHLSGRILYGKPVIQMPHIRFLAAQAYARLTAMKLFAYRALDYVHAANADDRRYLLFTAVQKAKVSTEGQKVIALLAECIGAKGFESNIYFEMALRDAQLIPSLEGSTHINLALAAQFVPQYCSGLDHELADPKSLVLVEKTPGENPYLMIARSGAVNQIRFRYFLGAYRPLMRIPNVRLFARQAKRFELFIRHASSTDAAADMHSALLRGQCLAVLAYGQLIAEKSVRLNIPSQIVSAIFHLLILDLAAIGLTLAASPQLSPSEKILARRMIMVPQTDQGDWDYVSEHLMNYAQSQAGA